MPYKILPEKTNPVEAQKYLHFVHDQSTPRFVALYLVVQADLEYSLQKAFGAAWQNGSHLQEAFESVLEKYDSQEKQFHELRAGQNVYGYELVNEAVYPEKYLA